MANEIKLKRGSGSDPGTSDLSVGEVAIRTDNGKLFTKRDNGTVTEITGGGGIDDGDKGDITVSNSGATFTIDSGVISTAKIADDAVTYDKIQNVSATDRILGRDSSGAGVIEEITPANLRTMINVEDGATADQSASEIVALIADQTIAPSTIDMEDDERIKLGASDDLLIYHDSNSFVRDVGGGNLCLDTNGTKVQIFADGTSTKTMANFLKDDAVELYHNGNKKFETSSAGATVTGNIISTNVEPTGNINVPDSSSASVGRARFGAGADLQIYHDGSNSYIANTTGTVQLTSTGITTLKGTSITFENVAGNENLLKAIEDDAVELYFNGNKKFETSSSGIHVTGDVSITGDYLADDDEKLKMGDGFDLQIYHDGSNSYVQDTGTGNLKLLGSTVQIGKSDNSEIGLTFTSDGSIQLRHDNSTKFETSSSGGTITGTLVADGFTGPLTGNVTGNASGSSGSCTGNAATATALETARTIAGVSFDGSANISLNNNAITNGAGYITDVVNDTSPQLGGDLASNGNNIKFGDSSDGSSDDVLSFGAGDDLLIYHYSDSSYIQDNGTGPLQIYTNGTDIRFKTSDGETMTKMVKDGGVELYHNATLKCQTTSSGINVAGSIAVSGNVDGRDIAADGTKLDGIADGATNVTNNNQLTNGAGYITSASDNTKLPLSGGELTGDLITHEVRPDGNNSRSLGTSSARWSNVFTNDLHLSNKGGSNKVDNTWGDFTIQEGIEDLFLINNRNGKMFKFVLQEVN